MKVVIVMLIASLSSVLAFLPGMALAEPAPSVGPQYLEYPDRGLSKTQVHELFGTALSESTRVGQPPITYWEYPDFTVYFEQTFVIHTVLHPRQP